MRPLQTEIIEKLGVQPAIDPASEIKRSVTLLKDYLKRTGLKSLVLGISGGQDSTLAGKLAQFAVEQLREETGMASINLSLCGYHIMNKLMSQTLWQLLNGKRLIKQ